MLKKKKNNKGFTLVELLVVIAIIGILAVVAVPSLFKQIDKSKATQVVSNLKAAETEVLSEYANGVSIADIGAMGIGTSASYTDGTLPAGKNVIVPDLKQAAGETYKVSSAGKEVYVTVTSNNNTILKIVADQYKTGTGGRAVLTEASGNANGTVKVTVFKAE